MDQRQAQSVYVNAKIIINNRIFKTFKPPGGWRAHSLGEAGGEAHLALLAPILQTMERGQLSSEERPGFGEMVKQLLTYNWPLRPAPGALA